MPDSVPNYLTIDPTTGAVGAVFTGKLVAQGIDFGAAVADGFPVSQVRWIRQSDGAVVAFIEGYDDVNGSTLQTQVNAVDAGDHAKVQVGASGAGASPFAFTNLISDPTAAFSYFNIAFGNLSQAVILDALKRSNFWQTNDANTGAGPSLSRMALGLTTVTTPAAAINNDFTSTIAIPAGVKPTGVAQTMVIPVMASGGGLFNGIHIVGTTINALGNDVCNVTFSNNSGVALGASTINLRYVVFF